MTDKVQKIREEVVRMHNLLPVMDCDNISVNYADRICTTLEMYIDSLQEEPVSEDFEKEVRKYAPIYYKDNDISKFARHFANWQKKKDDKLLQDHIVYKKGKESGMRYMKQQMMKDALEAEVTYGKSISIPSLGYFLDKNCLDFGNKVRVIIIKDE